MRGYLPGNESYMDRAVNELEVLKARMAMANRIITDNVEEVRNEVGGVIGYTLSLNAEQTRALWNAVGEPHTKP